MTNGETLSQILRRLPAKRKLHMPAVGDIIGTSASFSGAGFLSLNTSQVDLVPAGKSPDDFSGWQDAGTTEKITMPVGKLPSLTVEATWKFNGRFISGFRLVVSGACSEVNPPKLSVSIISLTLENAEGFAELGYEISVKSLFSQVATFRAIVTGKGEGTTGEPAK